MAAEPQEPHKLIGLIQVVLRLHVVLCLRLVVLELQDRDELDGRLVEGDDLDAEVLGDVEVEDQIRPIES